MKYLFIIIGIISAVCAQVIIKQASFYTVMSSRWLVLVLLSATAYLGAFLFQSIVYRYFPLTKLAPIMGVSIILLVFCCGVYFFDESIEVKQIAGLVLGLVSIYLILS